MWVNPARLSPQLRRQRPCDHTAAGRRALRHVGGMDLEDQRHHQRVVERWDRTREHFAVLSNAKPCTARVAALTARRCRNGPRLANSETDAASAG
jgi:hypothetical protein